MITQFTLNKETDTAVFKLAGKDFHRDLHRLCQVVSKANRRFDGEYWHVKYASQYADFGLVAWPEFVHWMKDFENQLELPIQVPVAQPDGTPFKQGTTTN